MDREWQLLLVLVAMGLITYAQRLSFILFLEKLTLPVTVKRALRFVPIAVLPAIIFPELLIRGGQIDFSLGNERLIAGLVAAIVAWRSRSMLLTIVVGMGLLLLLQRLGV